MTRFATATAAVAALLVGCVGAPALGATTSDSGAPSPGVRLSPTAVASTIDDRGLTRSSLGWRSVTSSAAYKSTLTCSRKRGAVLTVSTLAKNGGSVQVQTASGRGTFEIRVAGVRKATVNTSLATRIRSYSFTGAGKVTLVVTSQGTGVCVDSVKLNAPDGPLLPGAVRQLDRNSAAVGPNAEVVSGSLSPGGYYFAFWTRATNLAPGVTDGRYHLYVSEVATGKVLGVADTSADGTVLSNDGNTAASWRLVSWVPRATGEIDSTRILFTSYADNLGVAPPGFPRSGPYLYEANLDDASRSLVVYPVAGVRDAYYSPSRTRIVLTTSERYGADSNSCSDIWIFNPTAPDSSNLPVEVSANSSSAFPPGPYNCDSLRPSWSPDSSKILFESYANSLVPGDTNSSSDIFVKTLSTGAITRVSTGVNGQSNNHSTWPSWSPDGTRVAFDSAADNLTPGDANSSTDVFVKTLSTGAIKLVSTNYRGQQVIAVNGNRAPRWSPDGTRIAFQSQAVDLMPVLDINQRTDVYVKNLATGAVQLASVNSNGVQGNAASELWRLEGPNSAAWLPGGRGIAFLSYSSNFPGSSNNGFALDAFLKVM